MVNVLSSYRSVVAWCVGVVPVPGLTAVKGPVFRKDANEFTGTFVLRGLLLRQESWLGLISGFTVQTIYITIYVSDLISFTDGHGRYTHYVYPSWLHAVCVCWSVQLSPHTLLQPASGLYTCSMCWSVVRRTGGKEKRGVAFQALVFAAAMTKHNKESRVCFTWKCSVHREARHTGSFILSPGTVFYTVTGFVYWNKLHRTRTEEVFAVYQLLNWWEREWHIGGEEWNRRLEKQLGWLTVRFPSISNHLFFLGDFLQHNTSM